MIWRVTTPTVLTAGMAGLALCGRLTAATGEDAGPPSPRVVRPDLVARIALIGKPSALRLRNGRLVVVTDRAVRTLNLNGDEVFCRELATGEKAVVSLGGRHIGIIRRVPSESGKPQRVTVLDSSGEAIRTLPNVPGETILLSDRGDEAVGLSHAGWVCRRDEETVAEAASAQLAEAAFDRTGRYFAVSVKPTARDTPTGWVALYTAEGEVVWKHQVSSGGEWPGPVGIEPGGRAVAALRRDHLVSPARLLFIDATGSLVGKYEDVWGDVRIAWSQSGFCVITNTRSAVLCFTAATGQLKWRRLFVDERLEPEDVDVSDDARFTIVGATQAVSLPPRDTKKYRPVRSQTAPRVALLLDYAGTVVWKRSLSGASYDSPVRGPLVSISEDSRHFAIAQPDAVYLFARGDDCRGLGEDAWAVGLEQKKSIPLPCQQRQPAKGS